MNDTLDDYDFNPSSSSNLASLFDSSGNSESSSLIYTAPKQPKAIIHTETKNETPPKPESSVICAFVVQVWKLVDYKYIAIGKHGLALIGSSIQNTHELILYKEKRNVIVRIKISNNFEISLKKDDFASFYDNLKENWLIKFSNGSDLKTIEEHITKFGGKVITSLDKTEETTQNVKQSDSKPSEDILGNIQNFENKAKEDILSRIARMGQSILPNKSVESDKNEVEEENIKSIASVASNKSGPVENSVISPPATTTNIVQIPRHSQNIPNTVFMGQTMAYDPLNMYISENRALNSEVRINLSQISEKLNHVLKLVDNDKSVNENNDALKSKVKILNLKIENLTKEMKTYQEENTKLKLQIAQQQEMLVAEKHSQTELKRVQDEEISKSINFEKEVDEYKSTINNLSDIVVKQRTEIDALKMQIKSYNNDKKLEDEIAELNREISNLKTKLSNYEEQETVTKMHEQENEEKMAKFNSILKEQMNGMYSNIIENFNEEKDYRSSDIKSIIAQNIKSTTIKIIQNFQQISKNDPDI